MNEATQAIAALPAPVARMLAVETSDAFSCQAAWAGLFLALGNAVFSL
jgi:hypothetical protein